MVNKILNQDTLGKISFDDEKSLLTLEWLEETKNMHEAHFQGTLFMLAGYSIQNNSKKILIDARKFRFKASDEVVGPWRTKNISPLYNQAGVQKFAFIFPQGVTTPSDEVTWPDEKFPTNFFTTEDESLRWLFE